MSKAESGQALAEARRSGILLAVLLVLLGGWFAWSAFGQWRASVVTTELEHARTQALAGLRKALDSQTRQLDAVMKNDTVVTALASGDATAVSAAIHERMKGAEDVQVIASALDDAYADPAKFGYSRIGLLEAALVETTSQGMVVRDDGHPRLGLAVACSLAGQPSVVYVRMPLLRLTGALDAVKVPGSAYLALRQGGYNVVEKGARGLSNDAESMARPLGDSDFRVAAAVPNVEPGPFGLGMIPSAVVSVLLVVVAVLLLLATQGRLRLGKRAKAATSVETDAEPTLGESLMLEAAAEAASPQRESEDPTPAPPPVDVPAGIFRAYDIRGVVGSELSAPVARLIGQAIGSVMHVQGLRDVVVGRDGRLSGPELTSALIEGLRKAGCNVTDIGMVPTPVVYFGAYHLRAGSCVAVTGSHNPPEYNGFKIVVGGETLSGDAIIELHQRIVEGKLHTAADVGSFTEQDVSADYVQRIADDVQLDRPIKVVADAGNGVAGEFAPRLLEAIGAEVIPLHCDVDGNFPNHHPDPSEPANMEDLIQMVQRFEADIGVAFDGDADRLGVVTREGEMVYPDRLLMLFAEDVLQRNPGALVIYDVKCTGKLQDYVLRNGGSPMMWKTGHSLVKAKMRETDAELAGEMSGHFFFKERWYGFDDGLYAAARLLEILSQREETPSEVIAELPTSVATPELKVPVEGDAHALVAEFVAAAQAEASPFEGARLSTIDGLRADFADGWGLLRASNTTPVLVLRFEGEDKAALERIRGVFQAQLQALRPELSI